MLGVYASDLGTQFFRKIPELASVGEPSSNISVVVNNPNFHFNVLVFKNVVHLLEFVICARDPVVYLRFTCFIICFIEFYSKIFEGGYILDLNTIDGK